MADHPRWAEVGIKLCIPLDTLREIAQSIQENIMRGGYTDVNLLVVEAHVDQLEGANVWELFTIKAADGELIDIRSRYDAIEQRRTEIIGNYGADTKAGADVQPRGSGTREDRQTGEREAT